ncbi:zinc ABC transporter ATP-binding protein AztA [Frigoribacterium sp. CFBP9039]|nr:MULTISPECIES: zinc ABC transporter ATP-binding protein AztA [unclassified Frigoribacterium]MDY0890345.1 zinc ABC transporter ATP-binding protein AztA [Frigoribacterium sp. CFBP9030]MDY0944834.1 zinc ABC transporter ATP-binding protein AztA [Frigoribacterium sp. CFBP9039]
MSTPPSAPPPSPLAVRGLTAAHDDRRVALHAVDLELPRAAVTALVGHNGSGKSTLLAVLAGTHLPTSGSVDLPGVSSIAWVVQRSAAPDRLPVTVRDVVGMGRWRSLGAWRRPTRTDRALVDGALERLGLGPLAARPFGELSGGQRQRTLLAQALAQQADLVLLDEPEAGLDADAQGIVAEVVAAEVARGATVVHATHHESSAGRADRVVHLRDGRVMRVADR